MGILTKNEQVFLNSARSGDLTTLNAMIEKGVNITCTEPYFCSTMGAVELAAKNGNVEIIKRLMDLKGSSQKVLLDVAYAVSRISNYKKSTEIKDYGRDLVKEMLRKDKENNVAQKLDGRERHSPTDIILGSTLLQNTKYAKAYVDEMKKEDGYKSYPLGLINSCVALGNLDGLEIHMAKSDSISSLNYQRNFVVGSYSEEENLVRIGNYCNSTKDDRMQTLKHECMHWFFYKGLDKKQQESLYDGVEKAMNEIKSNKELSNPNNKSAQFIKENLLERVLGSDYSRGGNPYASKKEILDEHIADIAKLYEFREEYPECKKGINEIARPLLKYFKKEIQGLMETHVINHPQRSKLELPEYVKVVLQAKYGFDESKTNSKAISAKTDKPMSIGF